MVEESQTDLRRSGCFKSTWFWTGDLCHARARFDTPQFTATAGDIGTASDDLDQVIWVI